MMNHPTTKMALKDSIKFGISMIDILERLHSAGICHNDIKPDNIMMDVKGDNIKLCLIDFGRSTYYIDTHS